MLILPLVEVCRAFKGLISFIIGFLTPSRAICPSPPFPLPQDDTKHLYLDTVDHSRRKDSETVDLQRQLKALRAQVRGDEN